MSAAKASGTRPMGNALLLMVGLLAGVTPVTARAGLRAVPATPTDLRIARFESTSMGALVDLVVLAWRDRATDETAYVVERWGGPGCEAAFTKIGYLPADTETFEDAGVDLLAGTFWWRVKACNDEGCSPPVAVCRGRDGQRTTVTPMPPTSPTGQRGRR